MTESAKHAGGCHCGAVRYEVELSLDSVISCNCSICRKRGALLAFAPAEKFSLTSGEADLAESLAFARLHLAAPLEARP